MADGLDRVAGLGVLLCSLVVVLGWWLFLLGQHVVRSGSGS